MMDSKKAAMEMSIGTIVTIVLSVTMLVLGVILIQKITQSATGVADLNDAQMRDQITKLYSKEEKIVIYPSTNKLELKQSKDDGFGLGIRNLLTGTSSSKTFSYNVVVVDVSNCGTGFTKEKALSWVTVGKSETAIPIASGDIYVTRILFNIPVGEPLCTVRYRVDVKVDPSTSYGSASFDLTSKAK